MTIPHTIKNTSLRVIGSDENNSMASMPSADRLPIHKRKRIQIVFMYSIISSILFTCWALMFNQAITDECDIVTTQVTIVIAHVISSLVNFMFVFLYLSAANKEEKVATDD